MLCSFRDLQSYAVRASDGEAGALTDLLFDDEMWIIRYLALEAFEHQAFGERRVLVGPAAVTGVDCPGRGVRLRLTRQEVAARPGPGTGSPVSGPQSGGETYARSMREMLGYRVIGSDGELLGRVADFLINASTWVFQSFVIAMHNPLTIGAPGERQAVITPGWINGVAPGDRAVHVEVDQDHLARDPAFDLALWQSQHRATS
jgi:sporulation protein YlmC with PRC-barrel domain